MVSPLRKKSIALVSGKGGVGKTTTSANLAVYYARRGLKVGLVDIDPLSDAAALFDLPERQEVSTFRLDQQNLALADVTAGVFPGLDLLFPAAKLNRGDAAGLKDLLFDRFADELDRKYDLLIFDMPAGIDETGNLDYLPGTGLVVLVTNPEPTAHVAGGAYARAALQREPGRKIFIWHNKFRDLPETGFDASDVAGNYNRNMPEEEHLTPRQARQLEQFVFIPHDPSLDLLKGEPSCDLNAAEAMHGLLGFLMGERIGMLGRDCVLSPGIKAILHGFFLRQSYPGDPEVIQARLESHLRSLLRGRLNAETQPAGLTLFTEEESAAVNRWVDRLRTDLVCVQTARLLRFLERFMEEGQERMFSPAFTGQIKREHIEHELLKILLILGEENGDPWSMTHGGVLLFYFSLFKLLKSEAVTGLIQGFIPRKKDRRNNSVRDRHAQIKVLVVHDSEYRQKYLTLVKKLYPVIVKQMDSVTNKYHLQKMLLRTPEGAVHKAGYLKLLTNFLHDTVFSGLSVVVGFDYRPASVAFGQGAEKILEHLNIQ